MRVLRTVFVAALLSAFAVLPTAAQKTASKYKEVVLAIIASGGSINPRGSLDQPPGDQDVTLRTQKATDEIAKILKDVKNLTVLTLEDTALTEAGLASLSDCTSLHTLYVDSALLTPKHVRVLAGVKSLRRLVPLGDELTDEKLEAIASLENVEYVGVNGDAVTANGLKALARNKKLRGLVLDCPKLPEGALAEVRGIENLEELTLVIPNVTEADVTHLKELKKLRRLTLTCREMTDASLKPLAQLNQLKALDRLTILHRRVSVAAVVDLRKAIQPTKLPRYQLDQQAVMALREAKVPDEVMVKLMRGSGGQKLFETREEFLKALEMALAQAELKPIRDLLLEHAERKQERVYAEKWYFILEGNDALVKRSDSEEQRLLKGRYNAAMHESRALREQIKVGSQTPDIMLGACQRLLIAATELDPSPAHQIRVHEDCLDVFRDIDAASQARYNDGKVSVVDKQITLYFLLDAELQLLRLKRKLNVPKSDSKPSPLPASFSTSSGQTRFLDPAYLRSLSPQEEKAARMVYASGGSFESPQEKNVRGLKVRLRMLPGGDEVAAVLKDLPKLAELELVDTAITDAGLGCLADCKTLRTLIVDSDRLTAKGVRAIASIKSLRRLVIIGLDLTDDDVDSLAGLENLESLSFETDVATAKGLKALGRLKKLSTLSLNCPRLSETALEGLRAIENLEELALVLAELTETSIGHLRELKNLQRLTLACRELGDAGVKNLSRLKALELLTIRHRRVSEAAIAELKKAWPRKQSHYQLDRQALDSLRDAELPDDVIRKLAQQPQLRPEGETKQEFIKQLETTLTKTELDLYHDLILKHATKPQERVIAENWLFQLESKGVSLKPNDTEEQQLLKRRYNAARHLLNALNKPVKDGNQTPEILSEVSPYLLISATELEPKGTNQLRAPEDNLDIVILADRIFQGRYAAGRIGSSDMEHARNARLDAELQLLRLKRDLDKPKPE